MIDRREQILARLLDVAGSVPGIAKWVRNREDVSGRSRPAIVIHDAVEETTDDDGRPRNAKWELVSLQPQIYILAGAASEDVGQVLNGYRVAFISAIYGDSVLRDLLGSHGEIRYSGCGVETDWGEQREGRMEVKLHFTYVLNPTELI